MTTNDIALNVEQRNIAITEIENEPRARDTDIGKRLGFNRPRAIRQLIERNIAEFEGFGPLATRRGESRGQEFTEYWLTEEQALLVATLSSAPNAPDVRAMLIRAFVAWRRGHLGGTANLPPDVLEMIRRDDGISRMLAHKVTEQGKALAIMTEQMNALVAVVKPGVPGIFRPGKSAGEILASVGFTDPPKNLAKWFGNRLEQAGCRVEGNGHSGLTYYRLFDPDKAEQWLKNGGKAAVEMKIAERKGQGALALRGGGLTMRELMHEADGLPDGRAIVQTPGFIHFIDVNAYELDGTTEAAVIGADGYVQIDKPKIYDGHKFLGERSGVGAKKRYNMQEGVVILGKVVESRAIRSRPVLAIDNAAGAPV